MSVDANTVPEFSNNRPDVPGELAKVETDSIYAELREKIVSGEVKLNFSYLRPRAIDPPIVIDPTKLPLVGDDLTEDELLGEIDGLLDKLVSGGDDQRKSPLVDPNKPTERVIYL